MMLINGTFKTYKDISSGKICRSKRINDSGRLYLINNSTSRSSIEANNYSSLDSMFQNEFMSSVKLSEIEEEFLFYE